jgi:hypothetical protein
VTADSRDHPAIQDQLSATVQEAQRGLGACASGHKFKIGQFVNYLGRVRAPGVYQVTQLLPAEDEAFNTVLRTSTSATSE